MTQDLWIYGFQQNLSIIIGVIEITSDYSVSGQIYLSWVNSDWIGQFLTWLNYQGRYPFSLLGLRPKHHSGPGAAVILVTTRKIFSFSFYT